MLWGHDYLHNKHWLLQIPQSPRPVHNLILSKKIPHHMLNLHQPQWDSQQCLPCWTGKGLFIFNHMQIASHLLQGPDLQEAANTSCQQKAWRRNSGTREIIPEIPGAARGCFKSHYLCETKYFTRLTGSRASPKKCMVKPQKSNYCYGHNIKPTMLLLSLQEFSWKQPSDNLNSFPLLVAGACFCWHTKTQELWNM